MNEETVYYSDSNPILEEVFEILNTLGVEINAAFATKKNTIYIYRKNKKRVKRILSKYFDVLNVGYIRVGAFSAGEEEFVDIDKTYEYVLTIKNK